MTSVNTSKASISTRLKEELREFVVIAVYLCICFAAVAFFKASILRAQGIVFAPFGIAAVKALICAKFISLGRLFRLGERFNTTLPLMWRTLHKSLAFFVLLLAMNALEEIVVGLLRERKIADSVLDIAGGTLYQLMAASFLVLLMLIPLFAFRALGEVVGERNLVRLFFLQRHGIGYG